MRQRCKEVGLEPAGKREALKRRLKEHFKNEKLIEAGNYYLTYFGSFYRGRTLMAE